MTNGVEDLFMPLFAILYFLWQNGCWNFFALLKKLFILVLSFEGSLYIPDTSLKYIFSKYFLPKTCLFIFVNMSFEEYRFLNKV